MSSMVWDFPSVSPPPSFAPALHLPQRSDLIKIIKDSLVILSRRMLRPRFYQCSHVHGTHFPFFVVATFRHFAHRSVTVAAVAAAAIAGNRRHCRHHSRFHLGTFSEFNENWQYRRNCCIEEYGEYARARVWARPRWWWAVALHVSIPLYSFVVAFSLFSVSHRPAWLYHLGAQSTEIHQLNHM